MMQEKSLFKFSMQIVVRNYEIDWQGIVHNATYLLYFEVGRMEYLKKLGINVDLNAIQRESRVVLVRNEINYISPAKFDETINIFSRIAYIRNTSFAFEGILEEARTNRRVAENVAVHVWLDPRTGEPVRINEEFRSRVKNFEGNDVLLDAQSSRMA